MRGLILAVAGVWCLLAATPVQALSLASQVTNISDISLPNWSIGDSAVSAHMDMCVYAISVLSTSYNVTVSSSGGYYLVNGSNKIPYSLTWDDGGAGSLGNGSGTALSNGTQLSGRMNANILSPLCALGVTGPTARLNLKITQADMTTALAGTYNGTVNILISPN